MNIQLVALLRYALYTSDEYSRFFVRFSSDFKVFRRRDYDKSIGLDETMKMSLSLCNLVEEKKSFGN